MMIMQNFKLIWNLERSISTKTYYFSIACALDIFQLDCLMMVSKYWPFHCRSSEFVLKLLFNSIDGGDNDKLLMYSQVTHIKACAGLKIPFHCLLSITLTILPVFFLYEIYIDKCHFR
jgi:hypothetical protein